MARHVGPEIAQQVVKGVIERVHEFIVGTPYVGLVTRCTIGLVLDAAVGHQVIHLDHHSGEQFDADLPGVCPYQILNPEDRIYVHPTRRR